MNEESANPSGSFNGYKGSTPTPMSFLTNLLSSSASTPSNFDLSSPGFVVPNKSTTTPTPHFSIFDKTTPQTSTSSTSSSNGIVSSSFNNLPPTTTLQKDRLENEVNPYIRLLKASSMGSSGSSSSSSSSSSSNTVSSSSNSSSTSSNSIMGATSMALDTPGIHNIFNWATPTPLQSVPLIIEGSTPSGSSSSIIGRTSSVGLENLSSLDQSVNQQKILDVTPISTPNPIVVDVVKFPTPATTASTTSSHTSAPTVPNIAFDAHIKNEVSSDDTYLQNCQKLNLAPHLPPEGERSSSKKLRLSSVTPEPDIELTQLAAMHVPRKKKNVEDGVDVQEKKKTRRRERCRLAAARFRSKKKAESDLLEQENKILLSQKEEIQRSIQQLKSKIITAREFVLKHKDCF